MSVLVNISQGMIDTDTKQAKPSCRSVNNVQPHADIQLSFVLRQHYVRGWCLTGQILVPKAMRGEACGAGCVRQVVQFGARHIFRGDLNPQVRRRGAPTHLNGDGDQHVLSRVLGHRVPEKGGGSSKGEGHRFLQGVLTFVAGIRWLEDELLIGGPIRCSEVL